MKLGGGWNGYTAYLAVGDLTSDDRADLLGKDSSGKLWLYAGLGGGTFAPRRQVGSGFGSYTLVAPATSTVTTSPTSSPRTARARCGSIPVAGPAPSAGGC